MSINTISLTVFIKQLINKKNGSDNTIVTTLEIKINIVHIIL